MKTGGKQADISKDYKSLYEKLQRESMEESIKIQSLQSSNSTLSCENLRLAKELAYVQEKTQDELFSLKFHVSILEDRNKELIIERREMEIKLDNMRINNQALTQEYEMYRTHKDTEIEDFRKRYQQEKKDYQAAYLEYRNAIDTHTKLAEDNKELQAAINEQKEFYRSSLADKEREKMQTIDAIKKQMMSKACEMRNKALEIRREQLETTTRITFLQNDQLIRELEYQSSHTEKILSRNTQLEKTVKDLKRRIEIHEVVEQQIAKRNVAAKSLIKNIVDKSEEMSKGSRAQQQDSPLVPASNIKQPDHLIQLNMQQALIDSLESKETRLNQEMAQLKEKMKTLEKEKARLESKLSKDSSNVVSLLVRFYTSLDQLPEVNNQEGNIDFSKWKEIPVEEWPKDVVSRSAKMLLEAIRPHLGLRLLKHSYFKQKESEKVDLSSLKQNLHTSKYLEALKRRNHRSLYNKLNFTAQTCNQLSGGEGNNLRLSREKEAKLDQKLESKAKSISSLQPLVKKFMKAPYRKIF